MSHRQPLWFFFAAQATLQNMKKKILLISTILIIALAPLFALDADEITSEALASLLTSAGYSATVDDYGDVGFMDSWGIYYWVLHFPAEREIVFQSAWAASENLGAGRAWQKANEANGSFSLIRAWYEPFANAFYVDYELLYPESGLDEALFLRAVSEFVNAAAAFSANLESEGALD